MPKEKAQAPRRIVDSPKNRDVRFYFADKQGGENLRVQVRFKLEDGDSETSNLVAEDLYDEAQLAALDELIEIANAAGETDVGYT